MSPAGRPRLYSDEERRERKREAQRRLREALRANKPKRPTAEMFAAHMENGFTLKRVADLYDLTRERVRQVLVAAGRQDVIDNARKVRRAALENVVVRFYNDGKSIEEIASILARDPYGIGRILIDHGVKRRHISPEQTKCHQQIIDLDRNGVPRLEIARRLNVSVMTVWRIATAANGRSAYFKKDAS